MLQHKLTFGQLKRMAPDTGGGTGDSGNDTEDATGNDKDGGTGDADPKKDSGQNTPDTEDKKFTQAEVDAIISDRLKRAKEKADAAAAKAKEDAEAAAKEEQGEFKVLWEQAEQKRKDAEERTQLLEVNAIKERVARANNLPEGLAARLQGETEEDIEADAKALAGALPAPSLNSDANRGNKSGDSTPQMSDEERDEFAARMNVDPQYVKEENFKVPKMGHGRK